ncbi:MAG: FapA family protein [Spirochaetes bacterium]|nr:FapA family protein [Spirochaetota bacterium]
MLNEITVNASTLHKALKLGSRELGLKIKEVDYIILKKEKKGFFKNSIKVRIFKKPDSDDIYSDTKSRDGYFRIQYRDGYAYLVVLPPKTFGRPVYSDEIINRFKILNINFFNVIALDKIIDNADGLPKKIVKWHEGYKILSKVHFNISNDNLKAYAVINPPAYTEGEIDEKYLLKLIKDKGIIYGIKINKIKEAVNKKIYNSEILIAEGKKAFIGNHGRTKYYFNTEPGKPYLVDRYGRINLKELNFISNVKKETLLAELIEPVSAVNGKDVFGKTMYADTLKSEHVKPGKNCYQNGNKIYSMIDGNAYVKDGFVNVDSVIVLKNVDYSTGNINFDGAVQVEGAVADGFKVHATGLIEIHDCVGKAQIKSDHNVILKSGINGKNEGSIEADGMIIARFIEAANIRTFNDLIVDEVIMHSKVLASGSILLKGRRAEIIGGKTIAKKLLKCKKLGSKNGTETVVYCGIDPDLIIIVDELKEKIEKINSDIREGTLRLQHIEKEAIKKPDNAEEKLKIEMLKKNMAALNKHQNDTIKHYNEIFHNLKPDPDNRIIAEEKIYNGVTIYFGREIYRTDINDISRVTLHYENKKIIASEYR